MKPALLSHALDQEFPAFAEKIQDLNEKNRYFSRLLRKHDAVDKKITQVEEKQIVISEEALHHLKQERLLLKDRLYQRFLLE